MTLHLKIVSLKSTLFEGETTSVYLTGDEGEYELLPHHHPLIGAIPKGRVKIAGYDDVMIKTGAVLFKENQCIMIVEQGE
jgi:F0F1-type ATP synthase epsilon subunit